ncbi:hypothetical protein SUGI_0535530 [Cryptomeria japonica]|nr:hypothetical protein SUGI_0535530 [Cryptomeria japonica]
MMSVSWRAGECGRARVLMAEESGEGYEDSDAEGMGAGLFSLASAHCFSLRAFQTLYVCGLGLDVGFIPLCQSVEAVMYLVDGSLCGWCAQQEAVCGMYGKCRGVCGWSKGVWPSDGVAFIGGFDAIEMLGSHPPAISLCWGSTWFSSDGVKSFFRFSLEEGLSAYESYFFSSWSLLARVSLGSSSLAFGVVASFRAEFFPLSPIEVEILNGKLVLSLMDKIMEPMPIPTILVVEELPFEVEILFGDGDGVNLSPIEVELGVVVDARKC